MKRKPRTKRKPRKPGKPHIATLGPLDEAIWHAEVMARDAVVLGRDWAPVRLANLKLLIHELKKRSKCPEIRNRCSICGKPFEKGEEVILLGWTAFHTRCEKRCSEAGASFTKRENWTS